MRKVFLDTNILIDWITGRKPFVHHAEKIFELHVEHGFDLYVSALSLANLAYTLDSQKVKPHESILLLLRWVKVVDLTKDIVAEAAESGFKDFEDGLQNYSAKTIMGVDAIVTRNKKDFKHSSMTILSPEELIEMFEK